MAGFNSWGRTRSPKSLNPGAGRAIAVKVLADTTRLLGTTATTAGYDTENQRYLHVLVCDANTTAPAVTNVYGYCHAFQRWFEIPESEAGGEGQNTANAASEIPAPNDSGRAPAAQLPSDREYRRYDIAGIDKIAFVNADPTEVKVFAACSTF
jgi:hypothetical protein